MSADLRQLVEGVLLVLAALLPIVNPFGGAPVFLAMTADCTAEMRATLAQKVAANAFILLLARRVRFAGDWIRAGSALRPAPLVVSTTSVSTTSVGGMHRDRL